MTTAWGIEDCCWLRKKGYKTPSKGTATFLIPNFLPNSL